MNPVYFKRLIRAALQPVILFIILVGNGIMGTCAYFFYLFESGSNPQVTRFFDALWWAFCTVTTVGYGDVTPVTTEGRVVGMILMVFGIFFFLSFSSLLVTLAFGTVALELQDDEEKNLKAFRALEARLDEITQKLEKLNRG
jgi:voltage-gated potassium channel